MQVVASSTCVQTSVGWPNGDASLVAGAYKFAKSHLKYYEVKGKVNEWVNGWEEKYPIVGKEVALGGDSIERTIIR